jgi:hypothetical protein
LSLLVYSQPDVTPEQFERSRVVVAANGVSFGEDGWFARDNLLGMFVLKGQRSVIVLVSAMVEHHCERAIVDHRTGPRATIMHDTRFPSSFGASVTACACAVSAAE